MIAKSLLIISNAIDGNPFILCSFALTGDN
jgi:hypothetical protein